MFERRTQFSTTTPLPSSITRESVLQLLHTHEQMIDLNPAVAEHHPIATAPSASTDDVPFQWHQIRDGMQAGYAKYVAGFRNLHDGLQTRVYAPLGLKIHGRWTLGETLPEDSQGEKLEKLADDDDDDAKPEKGLWLREEVDLESNLFLTWFVERTLKKAHVGLVQRLIIKAEKLSQAKQNSVI